MFRGARGWVILDPQLRDSARLGSWPVATD